MTKVNVYGKDGSVKNTIELPEVFSTSFRPDIIKKTFNVLRSNRRQPYGADPFSGLRHATASVGKGRGMSRVPRLTQGRRAALAPCVVGGRRAHPPKAKKVWKEKINKKEKLLAKQSALAATCEINVVSNRGHVFDKKLTLPVVIDDSFDSFKKTKEVIKLFKKIGIYDDVLRSEDGRHIRAGRGKTRGRKYRIPKSVLIVTTKKQMQKSANNLSGVDVLTPDQLNIEHLAPGGDAGRLTVFTKSALKQVGGVS
jgi:large subunit ribosomal protein L4e